MIHHIDALASTRRVNTWLENSHTLRVLHIFDRACNLINEKHEVVSVVTGEIGNGPFNLVVENAILFTRNITLQSPISYNVSHLQIDNIIVQTHHAQLWDAHPNWGTFHYKRGPILQRVKELAEYPFVPILQFFAKHPHKGTSSLSSSLALADLPSAVHAAKKLAGLGPGLTPSGDDYIMGALYAGWIIHPKEIAERIAKEVATETAPLSTSLSGAWLKAAGNGEAGIAWHAFLEALAAGEPSAVEIQFSNILSIGATSGSDAMAGFIDTVMFYAELERKHVVSKVP